jgi:hypothetical protein
MMFAIVEWLDVDPSSVSVIPCSWLVSKDKKLRYYWCPSRADESDIKKCSDPRSDCPKYLARLLEKAGWHGD